MNDQVSAFFTNAAAVSFGIGVFLGFPVEP